MSGSLRSEALNIFKKLHRTRLKTFAGDERALNFTRNKINEEYRKNKSITDETAIKELIKFGKEVEAEVRTTVIQITEKKPGVYEANLRPEVLRDNWEPYPTCKNTKNKRTKCSDISKK